MYTFRSSIWEMRLLERRDKSVQVQTGKAQTEANYRPDALDIRGNWGVMRSSAELVFHMLTDQISREVSQGDRSSYRNTETEDQTEFLQRSFATGLMDPRDEFFVKMNRDDAYFVLNRLREGMKSDLTPREHLQYEEAIADIEQTLEYSEESLVYQAPKQGRFRRIVNRIKSH